MIASLRCSLWIIVLAGLLGGGRTVFAQNTPAFPVSAIPAELKYRANAVIRRSEIVIDIKATDHVLYTEKKTVTVFNEAGERDALLVIGYDPNLQIRSVTGRIYNDLGFVVRRFTDKDLNDGSAVSDFSLFEDSRVKRLSRPAVPFPYTLEYEYELRAKQTLYFPDWYPVSAPATALEEATFTVKAFAGFPVRFKERHYPGTVTHTEAQGASWTWRLASQKPVRDEPLSPDPSTLLTSVQLAPSTFQYGSMKGAFTDWSSFGTWVQNALLAGRSTLSAATRVEIIGLVEKMNDPREKAKAVYTYFQRKIRYVSVQIGIGGFQPMPAADVDRLGYGDCKGLVNYLRALLNIAGVESWYTIVEAGDTKQGPEADFPTINFGNHVILCLPFERDTTWLEATSTTIPFGFLDDFTDDRRVVACTPTGGKLLKTPVYKADMNTESRTATFRIDSMGTLTGDVKSRFSGTLYGLRQSLLPLASSERNKKLVELYPLSDIEINSCRLDDQPGPLPGIVETLNITSRRYGARNGDRLFIPLNEFSAVRRGWKETSNRQNPVYISRGSSATDTLRYYLPADFQPEAMLEPVVLQGPFGTYRATSTFSNGLLLYTRALELREGLFPADTYAQLVDFYESIRRADSRRLVVLKNKK